MQRKMERASPMPMAVVVRKMSQKMIKSPVSLRGKNTMAEKTRELTRVMLISSIILNITYVIGRYNPSFRSLHGRLLSSNFQQIP